MAKKGETNSTGGKTTYQTRAVSRALQILGTFTVEDFELSIADLYEKLGIHKSTLVRLLQSMAAEGFIEQNPETGEYRLGIKVFEIGRLYSRTRMMNMGALALPVMQRLSASLVLSANLAVRDRKEIVYVETVEPGGTPMRIAYSAGARFGLHHTALGKAIIAFLPDEQRSDLVTGLELETLTPHTLCTVKDLTAELDRVKEQGYAVDDEESLPGLRCVAVPIWNDGKVVAALSASGSTLLVTKENVEQVAADAMAAAEEISVQLGGVPAPSS